MLTTNTKEVTDRRPGSLALRSVFVTILGVIAIAAIGAILIQNPVQFLSGQQPEDVSEQVPGESASGSGGGAQSRPLSIGFVSDPAGSYAPGATVNFKAEMTDSEGRLADSGTITVVRDVGDQQSETSYSCGGSDDLSPDSSDACTVSHSLSLDGFASGDQFVLRVKGSVGDDSATSSEATITVESGESGSGSGDGETASGETVLIDPGTCDNCEDLLTGEGG